jgi:hypothetical protein
MGYLGRYSGGNDIRGFHERERELNTKVRLIHYLFIPLHHKNPWARHLEAAIN